MVDPQWATIAVLSTLDFSLLSLCSMVSNHCYFSFKVDNGCSTVSNHCQPQEWQAAWENSCRCWSLTARTRRHPLFSLPSHDVFLTASTSIVDIHHRQLHHRLPLFSPLSTHPTPVYMSNKHKNERTGIKTIVWSSGVFHFLRFFVGIMLLAMSHCYVIGQLLRNSISAIFECHCFHLICYEM